MDTQAGEGAIGGGIGAADEPGEAGVKIYMRVDDLDACVEKAEKLGGTLVVPPHEPARRRRPDRRSSPTRTGTRSGSGPDPMASGRMQARPRERATDEALRALAEPRRRAILRLVSDDELAAGQIAAAFDVTRTAVSQHLTVLRNAGLLTERRDGTRRLYRARPEGLAGLRAFLDDMWASSLDTARRLVETEPGIADDEDHVSNAG